MSRREFRNRRLDETSGAGEFNQYIALEVKTITGQNGFGESIETWATDYNSWAACEPVGSREFPSQFKLYADTTMRFRIPWREPIPDPAMHRINWRGRYFDIKPPLEIGLRRELQIEGTEIK